MKYRLLIPVVAAIVALQPDLAFAYIGPGAGLSALGTLVAFASAVVLAIVGFVWYPVKRLLGALRGSKNRDVSTETPDE